MLKKTKPYTVLSKIALQHNRRKRVNLTPEDYFYIWQSNLNFGRSFATLAEAEAYAQTCEHGYQIIETVAQWEPESVPA